MGGPGAPTATPARRSPVVEELEDEEESREAGACKDDKNEWQ